MTCDLSGVCKGAVSAMKAMREELSAYMGGREWKRFASEHMPEYYEHILSEELAKHIGQVRKGKATLQEFGEHYCLVEPKESKSDK